VRLMTVRAKLRFLVATPRGLAIVRAAALVPLLVALSQCPPMAAQDKTPDPGSEVQTAARARTHEPLPHPNGQISSTDSASLPLVSFVDGQLSINATDVSLLEILTVLRSVTGADIDLPVNASSAHVTAHLGPGPARKVLSDLLSWSDFDYIIEGMDDDPLAIHSVMLMARMKGGSSSGPSTASPARSLPTPSPSRTVDPEPAATPANVAVVEPQGDQSTSTPDLPTPPASLQPRIAATATDSSLNPSAPAAGGRSPSEMIQQLQQMYQQRRQLQEQQNQSAGQHTSP